MWRVDSRQYSRLGNPGGPGGDRCGGWLLAEGGRRLPPDGETQTQRSGHARPSPPSWHEGFGTARRRFRPIVSRRAIRPDPSETRWPWREKFIHREAEGLRITLPAGKGPDAGIGVALRLPVHGDCEITASFTILQTEPPKAGYGSGVVLQIIKESNLQEIASITRTCRPKEGEAFVANWMSKQGDKSAPKRKDFPSDVKHGQLRLVRQGEMLRFFIAEGEHGTFREIYHASFGGEDLRTVRFVADTGKANNLLDVRLEGLSLRTGTPSRPPDDSAKAPPASPDTPKAPPASPETTPPSEPETPPRSTAWLLWIALSFAASVLLLGGCLACWRFWRRQPSPMPPQPAVKPKERPAIASKSGSRRSPPV